MVEKANATGDGTSHVMGWIGVEPLGDITPRESGRERVRSTTSTGCWMAGKAKQLIMRCSVDKEWRESDYWHGLTYPQQG